MNVSVKVNPIVVAPTFITVYVIVTVLLSIVEMQGSPVTVVVVVIVTEVGAAVMEQGAPGTVMIVIIVYVDGGMVVAHDEAAFVVSCICRTPDIVTVLATSRRLISELQHEVAVRAIRIDSHRATLS